MIKLQIIGNLGKDCIVKEVNGKTVINFSVAHTERYKDSHGNPKDKTTWVECAYWTDRTAVAQYLTKGRTVYAEGSPEADPYTNKEGQAAATLRMRVQSVQLLGGNSQDGAPGYQSNQSAGNYNQSAGSYSNAAPKPAQVNAPVEDDLPF